MIQENFKNLGDDLPQEDGCIDLQRQITASRARMSHTLDELGEELQPKRLIEQYVNEYSEQLVDTLGRKAKQYASEAVRQTKENPLPLLALVAGIGFFISQTRRESSDTENRSSPPR